MGWWMVEGVSRVVGCPRKICLLPGASMTYRNLPFSSKLPDFAASRKLQNFAAFSVLPDMPDFAASRKPPVSAMIPRR